MLIPNNKQNTKMFQYAGTARFVYNWALATETENYNTNKSFINNYELRKCFTKLKQQEEYLWLNDISNNVTKQAIKDACNAYVNFFNKKANLPKFKSKKKSTPSFYQDTDKIKFTETHVKLEGFASSKRKNRQKLNWVRLAEHGRIPIDVKYYNPRITYDGINWWLSVGIEVNKNTNVPNNNGIGIDVGIKDLAVCSNNDKYKNINKIKTVKNLEKKKRRLQRSISRKYTKNKKGEKYCKTSNIIKSERKLLIINHRLKNIRHNHIHQMTSEIIKRNPSFICIEDLNVKGMMKNKHLSKAIQQQCLYEVRRQITYKGEWNNTLIVLAPRFYPSSKLCRCCKTIKKDLKLSDRIYKCSCGNVIDRDYQASLNLEDYGYTIYEQFAS